MDCLHDSCLTNICGPPMCRRHALEKKFCLDTLATDNRSRRNNPRGWLCMHPESCFDGWFIDKEAELREDDAIAGGLAEKRSNELQSRSSSYVLSAVDVPLQWT